MSYIMVQILRKLVNKRSRNYWKVKNSHNRQNSSSPTTTTSTSSLLERTPHASQASRIRRSSRSSPTSGNRTPSLHPQHRRSQPRRFSIRISPQRGFSRISFAQYHKHCPSQRATTSGSSPEWSTMWSGIPVCVKSRWFRSTSGTRHWARRSRITRKHNFWTSISSRWRTQLKMRRSRRRTFRSWSKWIHSLLTSSY